MKHSMFRALVGGLILAGFSGPVLAETKADAWVRCGNLGYTNGVPAQWTRHHHREVILEAGFYLDFDKILRENANCDRHLSEGSKFLKPANEKGRQADAMVLHAINTNHPLFDYWNPKSRQLWQVESGWDPKKRSLFIIHTIGMICT